MEANGETLDRRVLLAQTEIRDNRHVEITEIREVQENQDYPVLLGCQDVMEAEERTATLDQAI